MKAGLHRTSVAVAISVVTWLGVMGLGVMGLGSPLLAAEPDPDLEHFKAEIQALAGGLGPSTDGALEWVAADPFDIRRDGDSLVAVVANAKMTLHGDEIVHIGFDRLEIRQTGQQGGGKPVALAFLLPKEVTFAGPAGAETKLTVKDGRASAVVDPQTGRTRDAAATFAAAHVDQPGSGASIDFGPMTMTSKVVAEAAGAWSAPFDFELTKVEFAVPQVAAGTIERVAVTGKSAGPKLDRLEQLRDGLDALQKEKEGSPQIRLARLLALLPTMPSVFATIRGDAVLDGLKVLGGGGEPLVSLAKAEIMTEATGFDGDSGAIRFTIRQDGLDLAPSLLDARQVPHRVVVDFGIENLKTEALRSLLKAAGEANAADKADKEQANERMLGALAMLDPTFRIYDVTVDTKDVGANLTAEVTGSPLAPTGYTAGGDLVVRGFDAIPQLGVDMPYAEYLPLLKELAVEDKAPDGTPRVEFRLASAPSKWITVNGYNLSPWFEDAEPGPGRARLLKPADPPMQGADVESVQRALAAAKIAVDQDGIYHPSTAAAVARFQKQQGINISGVVDDQTRRVLGVAEPAPQRGN